MKKIKKSTIIKTKRVIRNVRMTVDSNTSNLGKFQFLEELMICVKDLKNKMSKYCFDHAIQIMENPVEFQANYKEFESSQLNAWEIQNLFQTIVAEYVETLKRHQAKINSYSIFTYQTKKLTLKQGTQLLGENKVQKSELGSLLKLIHQGSTLQQTEETFTLVCSAKEKQIALQKQKAEIILKLQNDKLSDKEKEILVNKIDYFEKLINKFKTIQQIEAEKPELYERIMSLVLSKKRRALKKLKLFLYTNGNHARHFNNSSSLILEDPTNQKYKTFFRLRRNSQLKGRNPRLSSTEMSQQVFDADNFVHVPLLWSRKKLNEFNLKPQDGFSISKPQLLITETSLRRNRSRKIHVNIQAETITPWMKIMNSDSSLITDENSLGIDINVKANLMMDSRGRVYTDLHTQKEPVNKDRAKNRFIENVNTIVELQAIIVQFLEPDQGGIFNDGFIEAHLISVCVSR